MTDIEHHASMELEQSARSAPFLSQFMVGLALVRQCTLTGMVLRQLVYSTIIFLIRMIFLVHSCDMPLIVWLITLECM